jgi:hypothetical protein
MLQKYLIIAGLIILAGAGCTVPNKNTPTKSADYFEKKVKCATYKDKITEDHQIIEKGYSNFVNKIFYSPKLDSCLFTFTERAKLGDRWQTTLYINDFLTNSTYYSESYDSLDTNVNEKHRKFDIKVLELENS